MTTTAITSKDFDEIDELGGLGYERIPNPVIEYEFLEMQEDEKIFNAKVLYRDDNGKYWKFPCRMKSIEFQGGYFLMIPSRNWIIESLEEINDPENGEDYNYEYCEICKEEINTDQDLFLERKEPEVTYRFCIQCIPKLMRYHNISIHNLDGNELENVSIIYKNYEDTNNYGNDMSNKLAQISDMLRS